MKQDDALMGLLRKAKEQIQLDYKKLNALESQTPLSIPPASLSIFASPLPAQTPAVTIKSATTQPTDDLEIRLKKLLDSKPGEISSEPAPESENKELENRLQKILQDLESSQAAITKQREEDEFKILEARLNSLIQCRDQRRPSYLPTLSRTERRKKISILEDQYNSLKNQKDSGKNLEHIEQSLKFITDQLDPLEKEELADRLDNMVKISHNSHGLSGKLTPQRKANLFVASLSFAK